VLGVQAPKIAFGFCLKLSGKATQLSAPFGSACIPVRGAWIAMPPPVAKAKRLRATGNSIRRLCAIAQAISGADKRGRYFIMCWFPTGFFPNLSEALSRLA
jgi:hypothetical protein